MPLTPAFYDNISRLIQFLNQKNINLYSIADLMNSSSPNDEFIKIYIHYPNAGVVAHRPVCPDRPNLISGTHMRLTVAFGRVCLEKRR